MTTSHKLKLKNVEWHLDYPDQWQWDVCWANGDVWHCETLINGKGLYRLCPGDICGELISPDKFSLAGCTRSQVYTRIHKVFDKMRMPKSTTTS